jgi:hypothetical protein
MKYFRRYLTIICAMLGVAVLARVFFDLPAWVVLAALVIGWPLVGTIITIDDDMPGGFSNPDGKAVPEWRMLWWWSDLVLVRGALVLCVFAVEQALLGQFVAVPLVVALTMVGVGLPIFLKGVRREIGHAV